MMRLPDPTHLLSQVSERPVDRASYHRVYALRGFAIVVGLEATIALLVSCAYRSLVVIGFFDGLDELFAFLALVLTALLGGIAYLLGLLVGELAWRHAREAQHHRRLSGF